MIIGWLCWSLSVSLEKRMEITACADFWDPRFHIVPFVCPSLTRSIKLVKFQMWNMLSLRLLLVTFHLLHIATFGRGIRWRRVPVCISYADGTFQKRILIHGCFVSLGGKRNYCTYISEFFNVVNYINGLFRKRWSRFK